MSQKRQFFAIFFGENIFKIITSVPDPMILAQKYERSKRLARIAELPRTVKMPPISLFVISRLDLS
jgi:hypothetical protein